MRHRVILVLVHAKHNRQIFVGRGRGDDDFLYRSFEMGFGLFSIGEMTGRFNHHLGAGRGPVELGRIALGKNLQLLTVDRNEVVTRDNGVGKVTEDRVIFEQMGECCRAGQVIDRDKFNFRIAERGPEDVAAYTAKAIDANLYCHKLWDLLEGG
jgi:hypothetical protein